MKTLNLLGLLSFFSIFSYGQEQFIFAGYNGSPITLTASSATVNDDIVITFQDMNVMTNFYTQGQSQIYMFGSLDTEKGPQSGSLNKDDLATLPVFNISSSESDIITSPNSYSRTINLTKLFSTIEDGEVVYGVNLAFRNDLGSTGNNQTVDLYIDLRDAQKDLTLGIDDFSNTPSLKYVDNELIVKNYQGRYQIKTYDAAGRQLYKLNGTCSQSTARIYFELPSNQLSIIVFEGEDFNERLKVVN